MNLREKEDAWGATIGGFACGSIIGLPCTIRPLLPNNIHTNIS